MTLLNLAGGDCIEDLRKLEGDEGFCKVLRRVELKGLKRKERRAIERRWRRERRRSVPSPSAVFRYLRRFHDPEQEKERKEGKAFIPVPNEHLQGFPKVNGEFIEFMQRHNPQKTATLDTDATLVEIRKEEALFKLPRIQGISTAEHVVGGAGGDFTYGGSFVMEMYLRDTSS